MEKLTARVYADGRGYETGKIGAVREEGSLLGNFLDQGRGFGSSAQWT